jgi:hypothetical protein
VSFFKESVTYAEGGVPMPDRASRSKSDKFEEFYDLILRMSESKSPHQLSASFVSLQLGVSRGWIYKYFGTSRESWIEAATLAVGKLIAKIGKPPLAAKTKAAAIEEWRRDSEDLLKDLETRPWVTLIYFRYTGKTDHPLGKVIGEIESMYVTNTAANLERLFGYDQTSARAVALSFAARRMALALLWINGTAAQYGISRGQWLTQMVGMES